jgi:hypothetical protein
VQEEWKDVIGYAGRYRVSNTGKIHSMKRYGVIRTKELRQSPQVGGYLKVSLSVGSAKKTLTVHSIVAQAFLGNRPHGLDINHKDGNKANNRADNLEYITRGQNLSHAYRHGLNSRKGEKNCGAKLSGETIEKIRTKYLEDQVSQTDLAKEYGVHQSTISHIVNHKNWKN